MYNYLFLFLFFRIKWGYIKYSIANTESHLWTYFPNEQQYVKKSNIKIITGEIMLTQNQ